MTEQSNSIDDLVERLLAGDVDIFVKLFDHYRPRLGRMVSLRMAPTIKPRLDASDVLQETYLEARRQLPGYLTKPAVPLYVWLRQVATERLHKAHRKHLGSQKYDAGREVRLPENSSLELIAPFLGKASTPSRHALRRELTDRVERVFSQLKSEDREVILLRFFEQVSNSEAAKILQVTPSGATMRFGRAMARFHEQLQAEFEGESHP